MSGDAMPNRHMARGLMGDLYVELWHPESPGVRLLIRPGLLRRLGVRRSDFATIGETSRYYRDVLREDSS